MSITNQPTQTKELVRRADIRTMRKDLKRLRESDAVKESEKIIQSTPNQPVVSNANAAAELEKQKAFLVEKRQTVLQAQLEEQRKKEKLIAQEKANIAKREQQLRAKLEPLAAQKPTSERRQEAIEKARLPIDQNLALQKERQESVRKQETEIAKTKQQASQQFAENEKILQESAATVKTPPVQKPVPPPVARPKPVSPPVTAASAQGFGEPKEKPYLKEVPAAAKESIAKAGAKESDQRKKFMEEVERWASST